MAAPEITLNPSADGAALARLYAAAFPVEDLLALVNSLLALQRWVLSLEARLGGHLVGHVLFTLCAIEAKRATAALLGPLAVSPDAQRSGIGSALVRAGLQAARQSGAVRVEVLGDPAYYGRFGFAEDHTITPPFTIPVEWKPAWQTFALTKDGASLTGRLLPPAPWNQESLWLP